jgi:hypothetical protein
VEHSFAEADLTQRLTLPSSTGQAQTFYFKLDELDDLIGYVAAESNHAAKKDKREWSVHGPSAHR